MTDTGAVYDLGYEPYEGQRRGRRGGRLAVYADGIRRVLGIRRKARRKILPWTLITIAVLPAIVVVGLGFFIPFETPDFFTPAQYYLLIGNLVALFAALATPELLIPDRRDGVLSVLSSRPMLYTDYVGARMAGLLSVVGAFLLIPQLALVFGQAATSDDGLLRGLVSEVDAVPRIILVAALYALAYVPLGVAIASVAQRKAVAAAVYIGVLIGVAILAESVVQNGAIAGGRWLVLLSPVDSANEANFWVFGETNPESLFLVAGISPVYSVVSIAIMATAATAFTLYRYRRLM